MTGTLHESRMRAMLRLESYADSPSAFLAMNEGTNYFEDSDIDGFIPYRVQGGYIVQIGGVVAHASVREKLLCRFLAFARQSGKRVCAVQLRQRDLDEYGRQGFTINQLGLSYSLDIPAFKTAGTRFISMRNKISRARKAGVVVKELGRDVPFDDAAEKQIDEITQAWLQAKGKKNLLEFMVGDLHPTPLPRRRIFAAYQEERIVGFISYVPSYGEFGGMMHDVTRRRNDAPPGVMELLNVEAIERFRSEGIRHMNFGLTPFCGVTDAHDNHHSRNRFLSWLISKLEKHGKAVYPAQAQVQYKQKWQPMTITPEYVAFHGGFRLSGLFRLLQLTRTI
jgi:phosphatidylglycerol lysyltransferase